MPGGVDEDLGAVALRVVAIDRPGDAVVDGEQVGDPGPAPQRPVDLPQPVEVADLEGHVVVVDAVARRPPLVQHELVVVARVGAEKGDLAAPLDSAPVGDLEPVNRGEEVHHPVEVEDVEPGMAEADRRSCAHRNLLSRPRGRGAPRHHERGARPRSTNPPVAQAAPVRKPRGRRRSPRAPPRPAPAQRRSRSRPGCRSSAGPDRPRGGRDRCAARVRDRRI